MAERVAILCYHRVHSDDDPSMPAVEQNCAHVTTSVFRRQMAALAAEGFSVVNHSQICDWIEGKADLPSPIVSGERREQDPELWWAATAKASRTYMPEE